MTAAILQGAPGMTLDTDLWLDLGERQYMRPINLSLRLGCTQLRPTVVSLTDGKLVNFCYSIQGADAFVTEFERAALYVLEGVEVRVMELNGIIRSKEAAGRPKDLAMLPLLRDIAACRQRLPPAT